MDKEFEPMDANLPNVIILEENQKECALWHSALIQIKGLRYIITDNPDEALCEWINLYSHDFIPRSIVCRSFIEKQCMGMSYEKSENGTEVAIDGSAFVLFQCMQAVGDAPGMFCLYTEDAKDVESEIGNWDKNRRVHILEKGENDNQYNPEKVIDYIVNHDEYIMQSLSLREN